MPTTKLELAVLRARNLPAKDFNGLADPFVEVSIKGGDFKQLQKTVVVNKSLNPEWNQTFTFLLSDKDAKFSNLKIHVSDKGLLGSTFMGEIMLPVYKITDSFEKATSTWYPLLDKSGASKGKMGEIELRIGISSDNLPDSSQERLNILVQNASLHDDDPTHVAGFDVSEVSGANVRSIDGLLSFEVRKAKDLPNNGNEFVAFNCDAFFVVSFGVNTFRSRVVKHSLNPEWDDRVLLLVRERERNYDIKISLFDHDTLGSNRAIGSALVRASDFMVKKTPIEKTLKLDLAHPVQPDTAQIVVCGKFMSYHDLKQQLWMKLASNFDNDQNHRVNRIELGAMLDSIGTSLSEEAIDQMFKKYGVPSEDVPGEKEILPEDLVKAMDEVAADPTQTLVALDRNPFNGKPLPKNSEEAIVHLAVSCAEDMGKLDQFVVGGLISEAYASKGWFDHFVNKLARGTYELGEDNANILVQDRRTGLILEEKIPTFVRMGIRVLYQNHMRKSTSGLNSKAVRNLFLSQSTRQGKLYDDPKSKSHILPFAKYHNLNLAENKLSIEDYKTFNEFFYRELKPGARVAASPDPNVFISPADCRCMVFPTITLATELWIKGMDFSVRNLLDDDALGKEFEHGSLCIFRLAPQDYHRFHSPCNGTFKKIKNAGEHLFTVNPMAVRENFPVYTHNKRFVTIIDSPQFGRVAYVIIGAMLVGTINLTVKEEQPVERLQELGYFAFGGSTVICVFRPNAIQLDADLVQNGEKKLETLIRVGDAVGVAGVRK